MKTFLTTNYKEIYYQPLQTMICEPEFSPEDTLKEIRTLIKIAAKRNDAHIVLSSFTYKEADAILEVDISISSDDRVDCGYALNFLKDNIYVLIPDVYFETETNEESLKGIKNDWNHKYDGE